MSHPFLAAVRRFTLVLGAIALLAPASVQAKDDLVIGITQFPSTFHPIIDAMAAKSYVLGMTQRPFTVYDKDWKLVCLMCEELPSIEAGTAKIETRADGGKGIAATYRINPKATWGDGTPITTKDVLFTWEVGKHPQSGVSNFQLYAKDIVDITAVDDKTFTLHFEKVFCEFAAINDFDVLPAHIERPVFEANPAEYKTRTKFDTDTVNPGLWFGPYRIAKVETGSYILLEQNPTWWGEKPAFKRIIVRTIENTAALEANLLSGQIDMIAGELGMALDQALAFEKRQGSRFDIVYKPGLVYEHIDMNLDNPVLKDLRVRRALLHAIDRKAISDRLFEGKQLPAKSNVNPLDEVFAEDVTDYRYDPKLAARLLEEAGWSEMKGGIRHNAAGERLTFEIMTTAGNRSREQVQQVLQAQWRQAGIDVRIRNEPPRVLFGETLRQRKYSALAMYAWISSPRNIPRTTMHSTMIPTPENNFAGQNTPGFRNAEADKIIDDLQVVCEQPKNQQLWTRLQQIYAKELPAMPLYYRADAFILPKWLKGVTPTGHQYPTTLWVENWRELR